MPANADIVPTVSYAPLAMDTEALTHKLRMLLPDGSPPLLLPQIKMPSGGALQWEVPGEGDTVSYVPELTTIILHSRDHKAYFDEPFGQGDGRPKCASPDGHQGYGVPGIHCADCEHNIWIPGIGKECPDRHVLYVMLNEFFVPVKLDLPSTSRPVATSYRQGLVQRGLSLSDTFSILALTRIDKQGNRPAYSKLAIRKGPSIPPNVLERLDAYMNAMWPLLVADAERDKVRAHDTPEPADTEDRIEGDDPDL